MSTYLLFNVTLGKKYRHSMATNRDVMPSLWMWSRDYVLLEIPLQSPQ